MLSLNLPTSYQPPPNDSLIMLPEPITQPMNEQLNFRSLKQGKFQSWNQYLATCEGWIKSLPKRKEGAVVEAFVEGIYADETKTLCEKQLDEQGWTWANAKAIIEQHLKESENTQGLRRRDRTVPGKQAIKRGPAVLNDDPPSQTKRQKPRHDGQKAEEVAREAAVRQVNPATLKNKILEQRPQEKGKHRATKRRKKRTPVAPMQHIPILSDDEDD